jgi:hypothetical protein
MRLSLLFPHLRYGVAALPTLLMVGGVIIEIAIGVSFLAFVFVRSGLSARLNVEAAAVARAGIQDALLRIARDKNFASGGYALPVGNYSATVTVTKDNDCVGASSGRSCITSVGTAFASQKKFEALTVTDNLTGEVRIIYLLERPI